MFDQCSLHAHVHSCSETLAIFTATDSTACQVDTQSSGVCPEEPNFSQSESICLWKAMSTSHITTALSPIDTTPDPTQLGGGWGLCMDHWRQQAFPWDSLALARWSRRERQCSCIPRLCLHTCPVLYKHKSPCISAVLSVQSGVLECELVLICILACLGLLFTPYVIRKITFLKNEASVIRSKFEEWIKRGWGYLFLWLSWKRCNTHTYKVSPPYTISFIPSHWGRSVW